MLVLAFLRRLLRLETEKPKSKMIDFRPNVNAESYKAKKPRRISPRGFFHSVNYTDALAAAFVFRTFAA